MKTIKWLLELPNRIAKDKLLHFFTGAILLVFMLNIFNPITAYFVVASLVSAKEVVYDHYLGKGNMEFLDFVYSVMPILFHLIS